MIYQQLYKQLVYQHSHLDWEEFIVTLDYDIGIMKKFIKENIND